MVSPAPPPSELQNRSFIPGFDFLKPLLLCLSVLYRWVLTARNYFFDHHVFKIRALPCPVISIGNLTVGGTGKTPLIITLADKFKKNNDIVVLSRGYGRTMKETRILNSNLLKSWSASLVEQVGDEPALIGLKIPGITLGISAQRYQAGVQAIRPLQRPLVLLDDGYQHRQLHRTINFLVFDATRPLFEDQVLPAGHLREPLTQMARADAVFITRTMLNPQQTGVIKKYLARHFRDKPVFEANPLPQGIRILDQWQQQPLQSLPGRPLLAFSGIGNPASFASSLQQLELEISEHHIFRDHHRYTVREIQSLARHAQQQQCHGLITTEKDGVKLRSLFQHLKLDVPCYLVVITMDIKDWPHCQSWLEQKLSGRTGP